MDAQSRPLASFSASPIAQPIATPIRALVTSGQEMASFLSDRQPPAQQILRDNPYTFDQNSTYRLAPDQDRCSVEQIAPSETLLAQAPAGPIPEAASPTTPNSTDPALPDINTAPALADLPDGSYRYVSGGTEASVYTESELRQRGGSIFLLTKKGDTVTGDLLPRLGLPGICVVGSANGNTVSGAAYPYDTTDTLQDSARNIGETFEPYGSGALQIRRTRTEGNRLYYASAMLDLSNFSRINAGPSLPPTRCGAGRTGFRDQR